MNIERLLLHLYTTGVNVTTEGQRLILEGPSGAITKDTLTAVREHRARLLRLCANGIPRRDYGCASAPGRCGSHWRDTDDWLRCGRHEDADVLVVEAVS